MYQKISGFANRNCSTALMFRYESVFIQIYNTFIKVVDTLLFTTAIVFYFLRRTEVFRLAPIATVMLPEARIFCSVAAAFEWKAGLHFIGVSTVSLLKKI